MFIIWEYKFNGYIRLKTKTGPCHLGLPRFSGCGRGESPRANHQSPPPSVVRETGIANELIHPSRKVTVVLGRGEAVFS